MVEGSSPSSPPPSANASRASIAAASIRVQVVAGDNQHHKEDHHEEVRVVTTAHVGGVHRAGVWSSVAAIAQAVEVTACPPFILSPALDRGDMRDLASSAAGDGKILGNNCWWTPPVAEDEIKGSYGSALNYRVKQYATLLLQCWKKWFLPRCRYGLGHTQPP
jgi:hypothetical protein